MKQTNRTLTPSQLILQKNAGYVLPILLWYLLALWMYLFDDWFSNLRALRDSNWVIYVRVLAWLTFVPFTNHAMGILSALCWQYQDWDAETKNKMVGRFSYYFWLASFPLAVLLICSCFGWIVFPIQVIAYSTGIERGERWVCTSAIDKFIGRKSDWERDDAQ